MARKTIKSETSGKVWKIEAAIGDRIETDATIVILESMKMEIPITAPQAGVVVELLVSEGDSVGDGSPIAVIEV